MVWWASDYACTACLTDTTMTNDNGWIDVLVAPIICEVNEKNESDCVTSMEQFEIHQTTSHMCIKTVCTW